MGSRSIKIVAFILIVLGIAAVVFGIVEYRRETTVQAPVIGEYGFAVGENEAVNHIEAVMEEEQSSVNEQQAVVVQGSTVVAEEDSTVTDDSAAPSLPEATLEPTPEPTVEPTSEPTPTPVSTSAPTPKSTPISTPISVATPEPVRLALAGLKIGIDPGHQKKGNSEKEPVSPGSKEKKAKVASGTKGVKTNVAEHVTTLEISMKLRDSLVALGAEVKMTREVANVNISNVERAEMMNEWGADLVLRIHCNGADKKKVNGIGLYVKTKGEGAKASLEAAELILPAMVEATGAKKDGLFKRDEYSGLNWSAVPSILVECGYMSNADEDVKLNDPAYQQKLADGMVNGVAEYFNRELSGV